MNSKMLVAFVLGGLVAVGVVLVMNRPDDDTPATQQQAAPAAVSESEKPAPAPAQAGSERPRPAPAKKPQPVALAPMPSAQPASQQTPAASEAGTTKSANPEPAPALPAQAKPKVEILRPSHDPQPTQRRDPKTITIPAGTLLNVRLVERLTTDTSAAGDEFSATLDAPLVIDGLVIAERRALVQGKIVAADKGGKVKGLAQLTLALDQVKSSDGQIVKVQTDPFVHTAKKSTKKDALKVGIGAGIGAAIGAIAGGGKGAAIGAGAGSAAGTGAVLATRGEAAELPAETRLSFRLSAPVSVTEKLP